ncbi:Endonuclease/exonuclease/phosphatase [Scleroderma citrinum]
MADNSQIESAPTPSIRSLKSKFEQLAQPSLAGNVASYSPTFLTPDLPAHLTAKRAPPPPPSRGKRSTPSPAVSPLLRPVPVPSVTSPPKPKPPPRPSMQIPPRPPPRPPNVTEASSPVSERKPLGSSRLPPPPTRQIGLGDKLPPVRRPTTPSSDEDSIEEEDPRIRSTDALPDSSRSSRRPPSLSCFDFSEFKIQVPAHTGQVAVAGPSVVVATNHQIKHFDLSCNDGPVWTMDTREMNLRDAKVSCLEFRAASKEADHGQYVWAGTKEGHLFEIDIRMGCLTSSKLGVHTCQVTHIFRYRQMMLTVDDAGKVMAFNPDVGASSGSGLGDVSLIFTQPRVNRIGEKQDFVKMFGGLLWTSSRTDVSGTGTSSVPVIRIYDPGVSGCIARCVVPTQHVGAVTSGTLLSSHPNHVYIGHEGGSITVWDIATPDGTPVCVEVMKVSASDVLCLEGVNDRLWVGGRKGMISAYDVSHRPWVVTNCWEAHGGLPVLKLFVDPYAIEKAGRLCVVSIGRNEQLRLWDGLLGNDWICQELLKREHSFSMFRTINVLIVSWNIDAAKPDALTNDVENTNFFQNVFQNTDSPDIIAFGFQEVIDLENRKMAAKTVLLGGKKKGEEGKISEKVTSSYKRWHDRLILAVKMAMPPDSPYTVVHTESLVGLFTCMFVRNAQRASVTDAAIATIKRGMGGRYGNKGAIVARLVVDDSSLCFINCHLAAGQNHVRQRNADVTAMLEEKSVFPVSDDVDEEPLAYVGGGDGSMVLDHEIVFLNGDMNYRIDQRRESVIAAIHSGDLESLLVHDQLLKEMKYNRGFRLRAFQEGPLTFPPTYKYDRRSHEFDTSEKRRTPAWCDRILWRSCDPERVVQHHYRRYEATISDHRPISAAFVVTVKSVRHDARMREKEDVEALWVELQVALLERARVFYVEQAMI